MSMYKTLLIVVITLFPHIGVYSQVFRYSPIYKAKLENELKTTIEYEQWYRTGKYDENYFILFKKNTIGVKKAIDMTEDICQVNGLNLSKPSYDDSFLASYVETIKDYENINLSISTGGSIILKKWTRVTNDPFRNEKTTSSLTLSLSEKGYFILFKNE